MYNLNEIIGGCLTIECYSLNANDQECPDHVWVGPTLRR